MSLEILKVGLSYTTLTCCHTQVDQLGLWLKNLNILCLQSSEDSNQGLEFLLFNCLLSLDDVTFN